MAIRTAIMNSAAALAAGAALGGCASVAQGGEGGAQAPVYEFSECPVIASRDWNAYIDAMPGPDAQRTLIITGVVDLPTPGFTVELIAGPADRMMPPSQRFSLAASPPDGMVTQVVTPTPVRYSAPATYSSYRSIVVGCGGKVLAEIDKISTAY